MNRLRLILITIVSATFGAPTAFGALLITENFDSNPSNWTTRVDTSGAPANPSTVGFSNTNDASGTSGAGEAAGGVRNNNTFEYYADTTNISGLSGDGGDILTSTGRFRVDVNAVVAPESYIGWFDTASTDVRRDGLGFSIKDEDTDTWRIRLEARQGNTELYDDNFQDTIEMASGSILDWDFTYDPSGNGGNGRIDATFTLVSGTVENDDQGNTNETTPGFTINTALDLTANPDVDYDAFGWATRTRGSDDVSEDGDIFFDNLTYTAAIPEPSTFILLLTGLGLLAMRRRRR